YADLIAYWNQNDNGLSGGSGFGFEVGDFPQAADAGAGSWDLANWDTSDTGGEFDTIDSFGGTTLGALFGDSSGGSFAFLGDTNNGASVVLSFDATLFENITLDFARRATSTGYDSVDVGYSTDGGATVTSIGGINNRDDWTLYNFGFGSALDGVTNAQIWLTFDGATSSNGNNRLDNVQINGDVIPTPASAALVALGGLVAARRRR
ncbi:MAG: hypothetical protein AAFP26_13230, partial [Planctomycetota bacterium]